MPTFNLEFNDNHPLISADGNHMLVDTGSPVTIHLEDSLWFAERDHRTMRKMMGLDIHTLRTSTRIDALTTLLGMDLISRYQVLFDYRQMSLKFEEDPFDFVGVDVTAGHYMSIPLVIAEVAGSKRKMFLDSGAKLSYLRKSITEDKEPIGMEEDFYPGHGRFQTAVFELAGRAGNLEFTAKYGNLPVNLQPLLAMANADGILGYDFFEQFKVCLKARNGSVTIAQ